jgi:lysophospholipase L1-like esterase
MAKKVRTPEEVQRLKYEIWDDILPSGATPLAAFAASEIVANIIVAEGDSWFDYPPGLDILDNLKQKYKYKIHKVAEAGDSLENMSFGTKTKRNFARETPPLEETLEAIKKHKPKVFLLSAGGNDIAGAELESYLNHADSGLQPLRREFARYIFSTVARRAYENIFTRVWNLDTNIHIISHGYGYAIPDGRAVFNFLGFNFVGPWLRPSFARKNITKTADAEGIIVELVDLFNAMLKDLDDKFPNFHYLDLRKAIKRDDWRNELHLYDEDYARIADIFHQEIKKY